MKSPEKIKVARAGKELGEFSAWEVCRKWIDGELSLSDDYWRPGMTSWGKLREIKEELLAAQKPEPTADTPAPPALPVPPKPPAGNQNKGKDDGCGGTVIGAVFFIIGTLTLLMGFAGDATGSAIRQGVLTQQMTNGILLMILGVLLAKK